MYNGFHFEANIVKKIYFEYYHCKKMPDEEGMIPMKHVADQKIRIIHYYCY